jgi:ribosomal protein S17E
MGKIKSKLIRRTTRTLSQKGIVFTEKFEDNKKLLGDVLPSKKIRNQIAGLAAKIKMYEKAQELKLQKTLAKSA